MKLGVVEKTITMYVNSFIVVPSFTSNLPHMRNHDDWFYSMHILNCSILRECYRKFESLLPFVDLHATGKDTQISNAHGSTRIMHFRLLL
jgi:hypothetical protein